MESALEVHNYLPLTYPKESESDYIRFLWEAFESNYSAGKYQFAILAFHMLYMSYVYFSVWQIKLAKQDAFKHAVLFQQKEKELLSASSPFTFSEVNERSIFRFLRLAGCENQHIGQFQDLVDQRNKIAHSNGNIFFSDQTTADQRIEEVMQQVRGIQQHITPVLQQSFIEFIRESANPDEREIEDAAVHVEINFMHKQYLSRKDIAACLACDLTEFDTHEHKPSIDELINALKEKLEL